MSECKFVEAADSGDDRRCTADPAYMLWLEDCQPCTERGRAIGIPDAGCVGHWACVPHAAEVRAGELVDPGGAAMTVQRIRTA